MQSFGHSVSQRAPAASMSYRSATVRTVDGARCAIDIDGVIADAVLATHILSVAAGQQVAVLDGGQAAPLLIVAAWPLHQEQIEPPLKFDADTGTLHIRAARLNLAALATLELRCGEALIRLTLDGKARIEGAEVLSAAIGANRIEGASIDLN
ncbi:hypothetical protein RBA41_20445 [Massilia sp. CCM 9210]|uniref:hypothetical protein n=1 Tax=Massilia scottii TaxID=3057166 RepID=UPI0027966B07|nr:hypothetical protein [Massilia sp. CCM 9210]MDQ1815669.1 hypothetical protein [Massilia sp. CCM 9210]